jgi:trans-aconitate 2-methyltransferase
VTATYAFRDSDLAAERLARVAALFDPTTRAFLAEHGPRGVELALDLGSGPGHTARLLADELRPRRIVAVDTSEAFLERAARAGFETCAHDVTLVPFPCPPADLAFCRFLLSHVRRPVETLEAWATQLQPGGTLLVEEVESIASSDIVFAAYLDTVRALLAERGHKLESGGVLAAAAPAGLRVRASTAVTLAPDPAEVAEMFLLNLRAWRDEPLVPAGLDDALVAGARGPIEWTLRQIAYEAVV